LKELFNEILNGAITQRFYQIYEIVLDNHISETTATRITNTVKANIKLEIEKESRKLIETNTEYNRKRNELIEYIFQISFYDKTFNEEFNTQMKQLAAQTPEKTYADLKDIFDDKLTHDYIASYKIYDDYRVKTVNELAKSGAIKTYNEIIAITMKM
jgi:hypothetical protein